MSSLADRWAAQMRRLVEASGSPFRVRNVLAPAGHDDTTGRPVPARSELVELTGRLLASGTQATPMGLSSTTPKLLLVPDPSLEGELDLRDAIEDLSVPEAKREPLKSTRIHAHRVGGRVILYVLELSG